MKTTKTQLTYKTLEDSQEVKRLGEILGQCFTGFQEEKWETYQKIIGLDNFRILCQGKQIVGGLGIYFMGQYFGGQSIPIGGIAAVGIAPEYRGQKAATTLMSELLQEFYQKNIALSTLYPATQILYRGVGYDQAGVHCQWKIPLRNLAVNDRILPVEKIENPTPDDFRKLYQKKAQQQNGYLDRCWGIWQMILDPNDGDIHAYWIGEKNNRQGYLIYQQVVIDGKVCLKIKDWVALNASAIKRLWTLIADHRSQVSQCQWNGSFYDPKMLLLPEQIGGIVRHDIWFMRIVNVIKALEIRPYPSHLEIELDCVINDPLLSNNCSNFRLQVSGGKGTVRQGGKGNISMNIRGLASLYTGFLTASQLNLCGQLEANNISLEITDQLFALPTPSLPDFF